MTFHRAPTLYRWPVRVVTGTTTTTHTLDVQQDGSRFIARWYGHWHLVTHTDGFPHIDAGRPLKRDIEGAAQ